MSVNDAPRKRRNLGSTSTAQTFMLNNTGNAALTISSIAVSGTKSSDFSFSTNPASNCGGSVAASGTCTISVTFTPTGILGRTASVSFADNASGSPQTAALSGTGSAPIAGVTTTSLTFSSQNLSSTSAAQTVTLSNTGNAALTISSIAVTGTNSGDFSVSTNPATNCGGSVAASGSCTLSVTFAPQGTGSRGASLIITDNTNNAAGSTQTVTLSGTGTGPIAGVTPTTGLTFSSQTLSTTSAAQTVTLNNTGNAALSISSIGFTGTNPGDFGQTNTCGTSVAASGSCTISITFTPTAILGRAATLTITDNSSNVAGSQQSVALTGTGTSPIVTLNASTLGFSTQTKGTTSSVQSFTLTNTGNANLTSLTIAVTGANASDFPETNTCTTPIAPNGTCTISVTFTPSMVAAESASVTLTDNAPGSPQSVTLTGTGTASIATLSTTSLTFSNQAVSTTSSPALTVTLTNTGNVSLSITSISVTGTNAGDFAETNNCPGSLGASTGCTISVTFTPSAAGSRAASVTIADNATAGSPQAVSLGGTGLSGTVSLCATTLSFGNQSVGTTSSPPTSCTLTNGGNSALTISSIQITGTDPGDYALPSASNTCASASPLASGGTCSVGVTFTPASGGTRTATLSFADTATNTPQTVSLTGTGTAPVASLSPATFTFTPSQPATTSSSPETITLSNTGTATLLITSFAFTGTNPGDFSQNTTCGTPPTTLAAPTPPATSTSCTFAVVFTPAASGSRSASLTVTDNNNNVTGSTQSATLSGTGAHDVVLTWTASPTTGILGYNIFRGTAAGGESTTPLNSSPVSATTYVDSTVTAGTTYFYVVTAVASNGTTQSVNSNEASATVPTP